MRVLRQVLAMLFGFTGAMVLLTGVIKLRARPHYPSYSARQILLGLAADTLMPLAGALFLMAGMAYWRKWRSARALWLAMAVFNISIPFLMAFVLVRYGHWSFWTAMGDQSLLLALGALTILALWGWKPAEEPVSNPALIAARPGDGTLSLLNWSHTGLVFIAFLVMWTAWKRWAWNQGLPIASFWVELPEIVFADVIVVWLHESGHALCGMALGQKVRAFAAGPFQWQHFESRWKFRFYPWGLVITSGATGVVPQRIGESKWREICFILAGPFMGFLAGIPALWAAFAAPDAPWSTHWFLLAMFASISLETAIVNLIPLRTVTGYSDGARIVQTLRGGPWAELHEVLRITAATTVSALRPRDYDIDALHRVIDARIATGTQALLLRLFAHSYYLDRNQPEQAAREMQYAETIYDTYPLEIPAHLHCAFVLEEAMTKRDAGRARLWWDRMEAKKTTWLNGDYWMARSALAWIEGDRDLALAAWGKADAYLRSMSQAGTYQFDRDILARLAATIEEQTPVAALAPA